MKKNRNRLVEGVSLIALGLFILGVQRNWFHWDDIWPFAMIIPGLAFFVAYFKEKQLGLLMPASILTIIGIFFVYMEESHWNNMDELWPIFILAPGIGFFTMFFASGMKKDFWIPGTILVTIGVLFMVEAWQFLHFWPVILILVGLYFIYSGLKNKEKKNDDGENHQSYD
ncbi:MAG: hypothetical protein JXQ65_09315 [Candidatus Marinimicrobia bacterium]|nr:hypothetical protein [Candidatus Neomarinimicrobiota bacterium]